MKTKTTKLLVLLMAVVMQGFVSVSWGQSEGNNTYTISDITSWNAYDTLTNKDNYTKIEITYPLVCNVATDIVINTLVLSDRVTEIDGGGCEIIGANCPLFSSIPEDCTVKNVKVNASIITYEYTPSAPVGVSPFANDNYGTIENCSVENCEVTCQLGEESSDSGILEDENCIYIGGLAGTNNGTISNCIAKDNDLNNWSGDYPDDTQPTMYSGQIVGYNNANASTVKCFCHISNVKYHTADETTNEGVTTSGILNPTTNTTKVSNVIVGKTEGKMADNLVLFAGSTAGDEEFNSIATITLDGCKYVYPLFDLNYNERAYAQYTFSSNIDVQKHINTFVNNASESVKCNQTADTISIGGILYSPVFFPKIDPSGYKRTYYSDTVKITSVEDWNDFANNYYIIEDEPSINFLVENILITDNLDFSGDSIYSIYTLPNYVTLDGQGHKITGSNISTDEKTPFRGLIGFNNGTIKNIVVSDLHTSITPVSLVDSDNNTIFITSPLCVSNCGTIERCAIENSKITSTDTTNYVYVGFLVGGQQYGTVNNCYSAYNEASVTTGTISQIIGFSSSSSYVYNTFAITPMVEQTDAIPYTPFYGLTDSDPNDENCAVFYIKPNDCTEETLTNFEFTGTSNTTTCYVPNAEYTANITNIKKYASTEDLDKFIEEFATKASWPMAKIDDITDVTWNRFSFSDETKDNIDDTSNTDNWPYLTTKAVPMINKNGLYEIRTVNDIETLREYDIFNKEGATIVLKNSLDLYWYVGEDSNGKILESPSISLGKGVTFDGGGYRLKESHYAFVDTVYPGATLKNLMIDCYNWNFSTFNCNESNKAYNAGFLANVNQGTIENCGLYPEYGDIPNAYINTYNTEYINESDVINVADTVNIGFLVGKNDGGSINNCLLIAQRRDSNNGSSRMLSLEIYNNEENKPKEVNLGTIVGKSEGGTIENVHSLHKYCSFEKDKVNNFGRIVGNNNNTKLNNLFYYYNAQNGVKSYDENNNSTFTQHTDLTINDTEGTKPMYHSDDIINGTDDKYGNIDTYKPYCYNLPTFIANFSNPLKWRNAQSGTKDDTVYVAHYNAPILTFSNVDAVIDDDTKIVDLILTDTTEVAEFTEAIKTNPEVYSNSIVTLGNNIDYSNDDADPDNPETLPAFNQLGGGTTPFNGTFDGSGYSIVNMQVQADSKGSGGFFKNIGNTAVVKNLNLENATIVITNADSLFTYSNGNEIDVQDTIYIPVFADRNRGELQNCSFVGTVKIDETIAEDKVVKVCFVGENYAKKDSETSEEEQPFTLDHAFIYLTDDTPTETETEGNKVCIVIKQHIGVGRLQQRVRKTCSNRKSNKALTLDPDLDLNDEAQAEINSEYREFTDEEFASGKVAYWLNYEGAGHTGDYTYEWTQGPLYPILDLNKSAALVKIVYVIEGESAETIFNAPSYGNIGSTITMTYSETPSSISVESQTITVGANSSNFIVPQPTGTKKGDLVYINVNVNYSNNTAISDNNDLQLNISSVGNEIYIAGAKGERVQLYSIRGHVLTDTEASADYMKIVIPNAGIYIIKAGNTTKKIIVR